MLNLNYIVHLTWQATVHGGEGDLHTHHHSVVVVTNLVQLTLMLYIGDSMIFRAIYFD